MRLRGVFDHREVVAAGQRQQRVQVGRLTEQMDRDDGLRARGDRVRRLVDVDRAGQRVDVNEHRCGAGVPDGRHRGDKGEGHSDHLVARPDTGGQQSQVEGTRARVDRDTMVGTAIGRELLFEGGHVRPESEPAAGEDVQDGGVDLVLDRGVLGLQIDQRDHAPTSVRSRSMSSPRFCIERVAV